MRIGWEFDPARDPAPDLSRALVSSPGLSRALLSSGWYRKVTILTGAAERAMVGSKVRLNHMENYKPYTNMSFKPGSPQCFFLRQAIQIIFSLNKLCLKCIKKK